MNLNNVGQCGREFPDAELAVVDLDGARATFTFATITAMVDELSACLQRSGLKPGHVVTLRGGNSLDWIVWDLAILQARGILHAVPEEWPAERVAKRVEMIDSALYVGEGFPSATNSSCISTAQVSVERTVPLRREATVIESPDLHSLVYSSGTSGTMKGIEVSRSGTEYVISRFIHEFGLTTRDRLLVFLPLSNYQQRLSLYGCLAAGVSLSLCSFQQAFHCTRTEAPSFIIAPPLFYQSALHLASRGDNVASRLRTAFGDRTRFLITGMAPIRQSVLDAYWQAGLPLLEVYGMTECGMLAWNTPKLFRLGTVGRPLDLSHLSFAPDGEVSVRRELPLSKGYFFTESPEDKTTFGDRGIIHTGDVAHLDDDGFLILDGRKKDLIVLNNGVKLHPQEIESRLRTIDGVEDAVAVSNPYGDSIIGIIVVSDGANEDVSQYIKASVAANNNQVESTKRVARLVFTTERISDNPRFLTSNLKLNRKTVFDHFRPQLAGDASRGMATSDSYRHEEAR